MQTVKLSVAIVFVLLHRPRNILKVYNIMMAAFKKKVFSVVSRIPQGSVLTYGEVARRVGSPKSARAVGAVLKTNFDPTIPCHRVIRSDGKLGGYNRGVNNKLEILRREGYDGAK